MRYKNVYNDCPLTESPSWPGSFEKGSSLEISARMTFMLFGGVFPVLPFVLYWLDVACSGAFFISPMFVSCIHHFREVTFRHGFSNFQIHESICVVMLYDCFIILRLGVVDGMSLLCMYDCSLSMCRVFQEYMG